MGYVRLTWIQTIEDQIYVIKTSGYITHFYQTLDLDTKYNHWIERLT